MNCLMTSVLTSVKSFSGSVITSPPTGVLTSAKIEKLSLAMIDGLCTKVIYDIKSNGAAMVLTKYSVTSFQLDSKHGMRG